MNEAGEPVDWSGMRLPNLAVVRFGTNLYRPRDEAWALAVSADGSTIACGATPGTPQGSVEIFDSATGYCVGSLLSEGADNILSLAWSPSDQLAIGYDRKLEVWNYRQRKRVLSCKIPDRPSGAEVWSLRWSKDGKSLAGYLPGRKEPSVVCIWDAVSGETTASWSYDQEVHDVAFSSDGKRLAVCGKNLVHIRDLGDGRVTWTCDVDEATSATFSPDGDVLAVGVMLPRRANERRGEEFAEIRFFDSGRGDPLGTTIEVPGRFPAAVFTPDGRSLVFTAWRGTLHFWHRGQNRVAHEEALPGYVGRHLAMSADGKTLVTAAGRMTVWDLATRKRRDKARADHSSVVFDASFAPDGKHVLTRGNDGIRFWTMDGVPQKLLPESAGRGHIDFSPDGKWIAAGVLRGRIHVWQSDPHQRAGSFVLPVGDSPPDEGATDSGYVKSAVFWMDGDQLRLISGGDDRKVRFWAVNERRLLRTLDMPAEVTRLVVSADGKLLAVSLVDMTREFYQKDTQIFDLPGGTLRHVIPDSKSFFWGAIAFSPGPFPDRLALPGILRTPGLPLPKLPPEDGLGPGLEDPDDRLLIRVWDANAGKSVWETPAQGGVTAVAISHSGDLIAAAVGSGEYPIRIWSIKSGKHLVDLKGHHGSLTTVRFSADDKQILSAGHDAPLLWNLP